jgi:signal transduction histidine kinase/CheY-like chemotaxis protein
MLRTALLLIGFLFIWLPAQASSVLISSKVQPSSIILATGPIKVTLNNSIQWLEANHLNLSLAQLESSQDSVFKSVDQGAILTGDQVYWVRFRIINPLNDNIPLALSLASKNLIIEAAYTKTSDTWAYLTQIDPNTRLTGHASAILTFDGLTDNWIYLRIKAESTTKLDAKLQDLSHHANDLSFYQQLIGASIAVIFMIILLHLMAIKFDPHVRHYLTIFMAITVAIFISSHSPNPFLPDWLMSLSSLSPWFIASALALSSFDNETYKQKTLSNISFFTALSLALIALILIKTSYTTLLFISLIPAAYAAYNVRKVSASLLIACIIFIISCSWQGLYIIRPNIVFSPSSMHEVYGFVATVLFASISIIMPYFHKLTAREAPAAKGNDSTFLSKLSHDFRTPMNGVLGMAELLKDTPLSQQQRNFLSTIEQSGHDLLRLINRVSDLGKIQSGKIQRQSQSFDLIELIEKTIERHTPLSEQNHVEIILNIDPNISDHIQCDEERLATILDNLILNALKTTENGELEIRVHWIDNNKQDQLLFKVRDSSQGINRDTLKRILSGQSLVNTSSSEIVNTEFGLLLSKHLVEALQGAFYIESNPNIGTTIRFSMLATPDHSQAPLIQSNALNGLSILIVDDNSTFRTVIQEYADSWGAQADATYNGKEALALLRNHKTTENPYDIMLIDQDMPIMNGFQLATKMQDDPDINQNIIKIMLTGTGITSQHNMVLDSGIHQVITKPVTPRALQAILAKHINIRDTTKSK